MKIEENNNQYLQLCIYIVGQGETTLTLVPITTMKMTNELFQFDPILLKYKCVSSPFQNSEMLAIISPTFGISFSLIYFHKNIEFLQLALKYRPTKLLAVKLEAFFY